MTFREVLLECMANKELVTQFNRLTKCHFLVDTRAPIIQMIDKATGYDKKLLEQGHKDMTLFIWFVWDCIWATLPEEVKNETK